MPIRKIAITKYQSHSFFIIYFTYKIKLKPSSIYTAGKEMPTPHHCTKCDILILDLLDYNLPADYPEKDKIREKVRKRLVPLMGHALKKMLCCYDVLEMQRIWNDSLFEAKIGGGGGINWRTVSNCLLGNLCESANWNKEIAYLQDMALADGFIKMKGMTHGRATILTNDWLAYCVYLVWTHMQTYHYSHNFPGETLLPTNFQFNMKRGGVYMKDSPSVPEDDLYW